MPKDDYATELSNWVSSTTDRLNKQTQSVKNLEDVKLLKRDINLFIEQMEQKKRDINLRIKDIRLHFDNQKPSQGLFSKRTRKDIDLERDKAIKPLEILKNAFDKQIESVKRTLLVVDKQVAEQKNDKNKSS